MKAVFEILYAIHPSLPLIYLVLFGAGVLMPAIYCAVRGCPYSIGVIWHNAKHQDMFAKLTIAVYGAFVFLSGLVILILLSGLVF